MGVAKVLGAFHGCANTPPASAHLSWSSFMRSDGQTAILIVCLCSADHVVNIDCL